MKEENRGEGGLVGIEPQAAHSGTAIHSLLLFPRANHSTSAGFALDSARRWHLDLMMITHLSSELVLY